MRSIIFAEGNGYGHVARDQILSDYLKIPIISFGKGAEYAKTHNLDLIEIPSPYKLSSDNDQINLTPNPIEIAKLFKPDVFAQLKTHFSNVDLVICDGTPLGILIAKILGKESIYISNDFSSFVGLGGRFRKRVAKGLLPSVLSFPKALIVPDFPPPLSVSKLNLEINAPLMFCGPLISQVPQQKHGKQLLISGNLRSLVSSLIDPDICIYGSNSFDLKSGLDDCEVVICHGGHTTIMEALSYGKPVICIVDRMYSERYNNAKFLESFGVGVLLDSKNLTCESLTLAIEVAKLSDKQKLSLFKNFSKTHSPKKFFESLLTSI